MPGASEKEKEKGKERTAAKSQRRKLCWLRLPAAAAAGIIIIVGDDGDSNNNTHSADGVGGGQSSKEARVGMIVVVGLMQCRPLCAQ